MESSQELYQRLLAADGFATPDVTERLDRVGRLIDISGRLRRQDGIDRALVVCEELGKQMLNPEQRGILHYFNANAWANRWVITGSNHDAWEQPYLEHEILELRLALRDAGALPVDRRCQILTNLGNALSKSGRFLDAIHAWDRALELSPKFGMAVGNRAIELLYYAKLLWHRHDQMVLLQESYAEFRRALELPLPEYAKREFLQSKEWLETKIKLAVLAKRHDLKVGKMGGSEEERGYRRWCLTRRLFLHPVNDLGPFPAGASDPISLPAITMKIDEGPSHLGFLNSMKQEFATARYLLFAGTHAKSVHFSDRGVRLTNTLDYPSYSFATEQIKAAFRIGYSIFDKVAFFLNDYLALGIPEKNVTFKTLWYHDDGKKKKIKKKELRPGLRVLPNFPLRGLFWLSKDLYEDDSGLPDSLEPEARDLAATRNHLEHKYLKIHLPDWHGSASSQGKIASALIDTLAFSVRREEFAAKTIRLLQLARSALIYLTCAVGVHEKQNAKKSPASIAVPIGLPEWHDDWKR
jgi:tetratricopeptide (TPR) repeat protein